ncbi:MAG: TonB-dependent receptor [Bacteroidaceae bacterium]|nr:TonB-dependent receptor [Bacteroidaceae bacterium]
MLKRLMLITAFLSAFTAMSAAGFVVSGRVTDARTGESLEGAVISLDNLWAMSFDNGEYQFDNVQPGKYAAKAILLGYVTAEFEVEVKADIKNLSIRLKTSSLALDEVTVTAKRPKEGAGTTYNIGREALDHMQISSMSDMSALMPGGKTTNPDLTTANSFSLRSGGNSAGNAAFATAVEVDGIRLGGNAAFGQMGGIDTRGVSVDNIDYIEVVTGVPSAEYGDLGNGMVRVHTKRGSTPYRLSFTVNPRTYQASVSKGLNLKDNTQILNVNAEWARAVKNLVSPYESYTRRTLGIIYTNTAHRNLRLEAGLTGNLGGMNSEDDPDAFTGEYSKSNAGSARGNVAATIQMNRNWITSLKLESSINYEDNLSHDHKFNSAASALPAVHSQTEGYNTAVLLPKGEYFSDRIVDSKELDIAASLKYTWDRKWNGFRSNFKAGLQWKTNGNVGKGEYYEEPLLASDGYRPRPYSDYPFMHTVSGYIEDDFTFPFGIQLIAGIRMDNIFVKGSDYTDVSSFSPRINVKWKLSDDISLRGGWGISEKMPSFYILFPSQEYRDILVGSDNSGSQPVYTYYTKPYTLEFNPDLKWQRHYNTEFGIDANILKTGISLVGFWNTTRNPYKYTYSYSVVEIKRSTGPDRTFVQNKRQDNGAPVYRAGAELTVDLPEVKPIRTSFRVDAQYTWTRTEDDGPNYYYNTGWSHTTISNRSYQYVGVYDNGGNGNLMIKGDVTHSLDANLTAITHIPEARLIITCKIESSLLKRSRNIATGSQEVLYPVAYLDVEDMTPVLHPFTEADRTDARFKDLVRTPSNDYLFVQDGYGAYLSANLSITKEIGDRFSLSFFANNFTNSRPYVKSIATGVGAIFTPAFYYGLSCRIEL